MRIVPFEEVPLAHWDAVCEASPQAWLFHRRAWIDIEAQFFWRSNVSFGLQLKGEVVGQCPLYAADVQVDILAERVLHSGMHRHTGLALRPGLSPEEVRTARSAAMRHIFETAADLDVDRIQLNTQNLAPANLGPDREEIPFWVEDYGFDPGIAFLSQCMVPAPGMATCNSDQIIDLGPTEDVLFARLEEACRRAVRKAKSAELKLEVGADESTIERYYDVAQVSSARTGEVLPPIDYYRALWHALSSNGRCAILFAKSGSAIAGGLILLLDKGAASFHAGVSDPDFLPMRVNDFLHWEAMLWAKRTGLRHYRLGPWFPTVDPDWPIATVSRFKKKFGGRPFTVIQGSFFRRPDKYRAAAQRHVEELCRLRGSLASGHGISA